MFSDVELQLYKARLQHMYKDDWSTVRKCPTVRNVNHLLGELACPACGSGRYLAIRSGSRIRTAVLQRAYVYLGMPEDVAKIAFVLKQWPSALTNLEYPVPVITYSNVTKLALMFDPVTKTAFEFYSDRQASVSFDYHRKESQLAYEKLGFGYIAFDQKFNVTLESKSTTAYAFRPGDENALTIGRALIHATTVRTKAEAPPWE